MKGCVLALALLLAACQPDTAPTAAGSGVIEVEVEGLMGLPDPATVTVTGGQTAMITLTYDTGIR